MRISDWSSDVCSSDLHSTTPIFALRTNPRVLGAAENIPRRRWRRWSRLHVLRCDFRQLHRHTTGASVAHGGAGGLIAYDDSRDCGRRPTADAATCVLHAGDIAVAETSRLRACVIHATRDPKGLLRGGRKSVG